MLNLDPIEIARLEERRQAIGVSEIASDSAPLADGMMSFEGPGSWANQAGGLGLHGPVRSADLDRVVAWFTEHGVPATVEVAAPADDSLIAGLAERGFVIKQFENVYAITPAVLAPENGLPEPPAVVPVREPVVLPVGLRWAEMDLDDDDAVRAFAEVSTSGFEPRLQPDGSVLPLGDEELDLMTRMVRHPRHVCFAVEAEDAAHRDHGKRFAAVAGMEIAEIIPAGHETGGVTACLFGAVTMPGWRRRGVQAAMIRRRVEVALDRGARVVTIQTKPGIATERNARRLGFELAYTKAIMQRPLPE